jgi:3-hydroxymyristoyl/3-hydroxydecanoyl-(acyl carrier protein) dehydratase
MRRETSITIPFDHPAFAGHFPGTPIVPGVVLLDEALFAIQTVEGRSLDACRIASAKFFHPVGPGATLVVCHEILANGAIRFDILEGPRKVASGSLVVPLPGAGAPG